jgi:hypothetical protein
MHGSDDVHAAARHGAGERAGVRGSIGRTGVAALMAGGLLCTFPSPGGAAASAPSAMLNPFAPDPTAVLAGAAVTPLRPGPAGTSSPEPSPPAIPASTPLAAPVATPAARPATHTFDMYDRRAVRWQQPDNTACTAASTLSVLNTIFYARSDPSLVWHPSTSLATQESILTYERAHMTTSTLSAGSDPHGWRNALNYYGWGSINAGVYSDAAYGSFGDATKAAVLALAQTHKPVGILAEYGAHAEFITGYKVTGADPATGSLDFTIVGVYLTDPWRSDGHRDAWISYSRWQTGLLRVRFGPYEQVDSHRRDKLDGRVGEKEWLNKWVIVKPVK